MRTTTFVCPRYLRRFSHLLSALLVLATAASCSSSQSAFRFRPAPSGQGQQSVAAVSAEPEVVVTPVGTLIESHLSKPQTHTIAKARPRRLHQLARPVAALVHPPKASAAQTASRHHMSATPASIRRAFAPQRPAEVGLGTTVLGVLGLIVLPLSLLGLLIWGGPVWLVLASLSALAVLIAYLDPFG